MLDQHDPEAWGWLLKRLVDNQSWEEAKKVGEGAMFVAIYDEQVHINYGRALAAAGDHTRARFTNTRARFSVSRTTKIVATANALEAASSLVAQKKISEAKAKLDEAKRLDPANAEIAKVKNPLATAPEFYRARGNSTFDSNTAGEQRVCGAACDLEIFFPRLCIWGFEHLERHAFERGEDRDEHERMAVFFLSTCDVRQNVHERRAKRLAHRVER